MNGTEQVWMSGAAGVRPVEPVPPAGWQGENDCVVGPFSSREVAANFIAGGLRPRNKHVSERIFPRGNAWFVEVKPSV